MCLGIALGHSDKETDSEDDNYEEDCRQKLGHLRKKSISSLLGESLLKTIAFTIDV
jgi:hypothetical protein